MNQTHLGCMRCILGGCGGMLGVSGQEVTRLICEKCGQNYQFRIILEPIPPKNPEHLLPSPGV